MKRPFFLFFLFCMLSLQINAQQIKYTIHTLASEETLSLLAKKYHTTVGDIMRMNGMHADSKLVVGQKIKIPEAGKAVPKTDQAETLKTVPSSPAPAASTAPSGNGIHVVQKGETLYSISKKYGVTVNDLQKWNFLQNENVELGQKLAVSAGAVNVSNESQVQKQETVQPVSQKPTVTETQQVDEEAKTLSDKNEAANVVKDAAANASDTEKNVQSSSVKQILVAADGSDNFFAKDFTQSKNAKSVKMVTGEAGIFKTASGWDDKKFYILMNESPTGSVVKIKSTAGSVIYAKVLWPIDEIKANEGLRFRISDAAAAALGESDQKFGLTVQYH